MPSELDDLIDQHAPKPDAASTQASPAPAAQKPTTDQKPAPTTEPGAAPPSQPSTPSKRTFKYKVDREEREEDWDEVYLDETKRTAFVNAYQRGLNAEREIKREREAERAARDAFVLEVLREQGFEWTDDPGVRGGLRFRAKGAAAPAPNQHANQSATPDRDDLKRRAREGDAAAIVELNELTEREFRDWRQAQEKEAAKREHEAKVQRYGEYVGAELRKAFEAHEALKDAPEEIRKNVFRLAWDRAHEPGATPQAGVDLVAQMANGLKSVVERRVKDTLSKAPPAPTAPPVHGGAPAGASLKTTNKNTSDLDELIDQHVGTG